MCTRWLKFTRHTCVCCPQISCDVTRPCAFTHFLADEFYFTHFNFAHTSFCIKKLELPNVKKKKISKKHWWVEGDFLTYRGKRWKWDLPVLSSWKKVQRKVMNHHMKSAVVEFPSKADCIYKRNCLSHFYTINWFLNFWCSYRSI